MTDLQKEIDEILVDCYGEDEEMMSWEVAFSDGVAVPFSALLLGMPVKVQGFRINDNLTLQCRVLREKHERWIGIEDLDQEKLPADFRHLLELYQTWGGGGGK